MLYGADYYPEHWPRDRWETDASLMQKAGLNVVRMAEFAWAKLEPALGEFDFTWLDEAIAILAAHGVRTILGTPTATPPKWLCNIIPDIYPLDKYSHARGFGTRRHYCFNSPEYLNHSWRIAAKMADHYKDNPNIVAWQIDNEFGCQNTGMCFCENCRKAFVVWLKEKYEMLEAVNEAWGTIFWSQTYYTWDEIQMPTYAACDTKEEEFSGINPSLLLDFRRFSSDSVVKYQKVQVDAIAALDLRPITHNFMGNFSELDYFELAKDLDIVTWDNYIQHQWSAPSGEITAMAHDTMRGLKQKNFWVMEQQSGPCGWSTMGETPEPGQLRLWAWQSVAHGGDAIIYFRWRAATVGAEQYWYGILDHDGKPRRRFSEIAITGTELKHAEERIIGSKVRAKVAIIKSYENHWAHAQQPHAKGFSYRDLLLNYYTALSRNNITCDIVSIDSTLTGYELIIAPALNVISDEHASKLERFVADGGILVTTFRSGTRTANNTMRTETLPGAFREVTGIEVEEFTTLSNGNSARVRGTFGEGTATLWCDIIKPISAQPLAQYCERYFAGQPAVTVNDHGIGRCYYVGCNLEQAALNKLIGDIAELSAIEPAIEQCDSSIESLWRDKQGASTLLLLNHSSDPAKAVLPYSMVDILTDTEYSSEIELTSYAVMALVKKQ